MTTAHNLQAVVTALSKTFAVLIKPHFLSCENILSYYPGILHSCHMSSCQLCVALMYVCSVFQMPSQTLEAPVVAFAPFAPPW